MQKAARAREEAGLAHFLNRRNAAYKLLEGESRCFLRGIVNLRGSGSHPIKDIGTDELGINESGERM